MSKAKDNWDNCVAMRQLHIWLGALLLLAVALMLLQLLQWSGK